MSLSADSPERAFVLGLDGVPWYLVERWVEAGELPNFARIVEEGAAGPLRSTVPAVTPLAWPSIATGTWPGKHGVLGFQKLSAGYGQRVYTSDDLRRPPLWELLQPSLVGNVPVTYPATPLQGKMVTGMATPSMDGQFAHPPELAGEVRERIPDYRIDLEWGQFRGRTDEFRAELRELVEARCELMRLFMDEDDWRLFFFVYTAPDRLQHLVWEDEPLLDHYRHLDDVLGEVMEYAETRDAVLFVVSDHGFGPISKFVYVNRILEDAGYLVRRERDGTGGVLSRLGLSRTRLKSALGRVGVSDRLLLEYLPRSFVEGVAQRVPGEHALYDVDHSRTTAFVFGPGMVYVNDVERFEEGIVEPGQVPEIKRELRTLFSGVTDPDTGEAVLEVLDGDDLFPDAEGIAPDLVVEPEEGYERAKALTDRTFAPTAGRKAASHRPAGLFMGWGPSVMPGTAPDEATVVDVAPHLLHCLGEPVGEDMDGRVLREILHPASAPASRPAATRDYGPRHGEPAEGADEADDEDVRERLRGLGYLE